MAQQLIYEFLADWVKKVLVTDLGLTITIIQSHQNVPVPADPYIVINYAPRRTKSGRAALDQSTDDSGKLNTYNDYLYNVEIREVGGNGSYLQSLIDSIDTQAIIDFWKAQNFSYLTQMPIQPIPATEENEWRRESVLEIVVMGNVKTQQTTDYIADIGAVGTIPGQGRTGDHTLNIQED